MGRQAMEVESISLGALNNVNKQRSKARFSSSSVKPREDLTQVSPKDSVEQPILEHQSEPIPGPNYDDFPEGGLRANLVVLGALSAVIIVFGNMNTVGVIQAYVSEHILMDSSASTVGWIFSVYFFFSFFGGIYAGPIFDYTGSTIPMYLGSSFIIGGLFATANCRTVWQFILAFGVVVGVGTSFLMNCCISSVSHYFLKRRGTALGVCSLGGAIGGVVWPLLLRELYPRLGFEWAMRVYGFLSCFFLGMGCLLVKNRITKHKGDKKGVALVKDSFVLQDLIKDPAYLFLTLSILLCEFSLVLAITYISSYTIHQGHSEGDAFMVTIVCNAVGIPGRYLPNYLADRYGSMNIMFACVSVCSILIFSLWLPFGWNLKCMYAFSGLYGFFSSSTLSLTPVCCGLIGKTEDFGKKYGTVYFLVAFGNLVSLPIGGAIIGNGSGYSNMIIFCGVLEAIAAVLWLMTRYTLVGWKWAKI